MKRSLTTVGLFSPLMLLSQYSSQDIKKLKISKMTMVTSTSDGGESGKSEYYYDRNGKDTAYYSDGILNYRTVLNYDNRQRPVKRIRYRADGSESDSAVYVYQADGSCKLSNTDKTYGMKDFEWINKTGKTLKTQSPDGAQRIYFYDAKGKLAGIKTKAGPNGGTHVDIKYTYNTKGQLIKEVSSGEYKWTTAYSYDNKGLLSKASNTSPGESKSETVYSFEFWE